MPGFTELTINSWEQLNEELFRDTWNAPIKRYRSNFAYRGVNNASYKLSNGLSRLGVPYPNMEQNLVKQFKKYANRQVVERDTDWHWLSVAQHHGLPTRLLDWTYSPIIAVHFATSSMAEYSADSAIWRVNFAEVHGLLQNEYKDKLLQSGSNIFSIDDIANSIPDLTTLSAKHSSISDVAIFFEPPSINERITNQFAYFSALSDPFLDMDDWFAKSYVQSQVTIAKIVIPASLKWKVRDHLDQSNVTERVLFPGLDGLCLWLKRHYMPI
jgi:hypothetical protein